MVTPPKPSGDFLWTQEPWGPVLRCTAMSGTARHCFSTRQLVLSGALDDLADSWTPLARALDLNAGIESIVRLRQVHCAGVFEGRGAAQIPLRYADWPEADIAVSRDPSLVLTVRAADCVPVLLADRGTGAVAAIHAGWRGTAAGAVIAAIDALGSRFGTKPCDVIAAIGPSIGPCCYTVGEDVAEQFAAHPEADRWFESSNGSTRLNLWRATRDQLSRAGLPATHIHISGLCTFDHPEVFHSYRRDGKAAGRLVAAIRAGERI